MPLQLSTEKTEEAQESFDTGELLQDGSLRFGHTEVWWRVACESVNGVGLSEFVIVLVRT